MKKVKLTSVCRPKQWKSIPISELSDVGYPVYGANGVIGYYDSYNHEQETVIITCRGATCGTVNLTHPRSYVTGNAMCLDNVKDSVDIKYLFYSMQAYDFTKVISGTAQPQITRVGLEKVEITLPSLDVQREIVSILDKINALIEQRRLQLKKLEELVKARFVEMFGDPVINSRGWSKSLIGDYCFVTKLAGFEYTQYINYDDSGDVVMVKAQNVKNGKLNRKDLSFISNEVSDSLPRSQLAQGDIVMTYVGANIGDVAVIDDKYKYHLAPNVAKIRPNSEIYDSTYFMYMLMLLNAYIVKNSADTAKAALGMERIRKLNVFTPPIELQQQFSAFVAAIDKSKLLSGCRFFHSWAPANRDNLNHVGVPRRRTKVLRGGRRQQFRRQTGII